MILRYQVHKLEKQRNGYVKSYGSMVLYGGDKDIEVYDIWESLSGGHGKGTIPHAIFTFGKPSLLTDIEANKAFKGQGCWVIPLIPDSVLLGRDSFAIHPDGNVPGTLGCISPIDNDLSVWFALKPLIDSGELKIMEVL